MRQLRQPYRESWESSRLQLGEMTRQRTYIPENASRFRHRAVASPIPFDAEFFFGEVLNGEEENYEVGRIEDAVLPDKYGVRVHGGFIDERQRSKLGANEILDLLICNSHLFSLVERYKLRPVPGT